LTSALLLTHRPPLSTLFPYTTLFRSLVPGAAAVRCADRRERPEHHAGGAQPGDLDEVPGPGAGVGVQRGKPRRTLALGAEHAAAAQAVRCHPQRDVLRRAA